MAHFIVLSGVNNSGKTTSLRIAYNTVKATADRIIVKIPRQHRKEVRGAVLEIDGVRVGFISLGDLAAILEAWFQKLLKNWNCDIIVCASRSRGETVAYLKGLEHEGHTLKWIEKVRVASDGHKEANRKTATKVVEVLKQTITSCHNSRSTRKKKVRVLQLAAR